MSIRDDSDQIHPYQRQYAHVYHQRLQALAPHCWDSVKQQQQQQQPLANRDDTSNPTSSSSSSSSNSSEYTHVSRILELQENVPSIAVGTLVKESSSGKAKDASTLVVAPSGDDTYDDDNNVKTTIHNTCRTTDVLYLEDESGRVALQPSATALPSHWVHHYPTGVVAAVQGTVGADGVMTVQAIYHATRSIEILPEAPAEQGSPETAGFSEHNNNTMMNEEDNLNHAPLLLLLSGLQCGDAAASTLPRELLLTYLQGALGAEHLARRVCHVVIAGGLCHPLSSSGVSSCSSSLSPSSSSSSFILDRVAAVRELDAFLFGLAALGLPVDVVPGRDDPTTANWPQRPLHRSLLKQTNRYFASAPSSSLVHSTPNPYAAQLEIKLDDSSPNDTKATVPKMRMIGTDGLNVHDLQQHVVNDNGTAPIAELDALQKTLEWGHLCPTGPDTVPTAPHAEQDPMVLLPCLEGGNDDDDDKNGSDVLPQLYFCGNATEFATRRVNVTTKGNHPSQTVRLVCIPKFAETSTAVLVNVKTLEVELLKFQVF